MIGHRVDTDFWFELEAVDLDLINKNQTLNCEVKTSTSLYLYRLTVKDNISKLGLVRAQGHINRGFSLKVSKEDNSRVVEVVLDRQHLDNLLNGQDMWNRFCEFRLSMGNKLQIHLNETIVMAGYTL